jgi:hypothetical protein
MPMLADSLGKLNAIFQQSNVGELVGSAGDFAQGKPLPEALAGLVTERGSVERRLLVAYLDRMPSALKESLRSVIHAALTASPPMMITFAWTATYDWGIDYWQGPCQITVQIRSRYPEDKAPPAGDGQG